MLNNSTYNKIKIIYKVSSLIWFIEKYAIKDAITANDTLCVEILKKLKKNLEENLERLQAGIY